MHLRNWIFLAGLAVLIASGVTLVMRDPVQTSNNSSGTIAQGLTLAITYCAECHAIGATGDSPFPPAPHFRDLHLRYDVALLAEALVEGIVTAHPDMPEFEFDPDQADAIINYLKSLEP